MPASLATKNVRKVRLKAVQPIRTFLSSWASVDGYKTNCISMPNTIRFDDAIFGVWVVMLFMTRLNDPPSRLTLLFLSAHPMLSSMTLNLLQKF